MPTKIEQGYIDQGFTLPDGMTWERVAKMRTEYEVGDIYVPIGPGPGCWTWGVPMRDGEFMAHTEETIVAYRLGAQACREAYDTFVCTVVDHRCPWGLAALELRQFWQRGWQDAMTAILATEAA